MYTGVMVLWITPLSSNPSDSEFVSNENIINVFLKITKSSEHPSIQGRSWGRADGAAALAPNLKGAILDIPYIA
jgi:hypothetical protein